MSTVPEHDAGEQTPTTGELQEPSTEKEPDEEPKAPAPDPADPSHRATGIGVVDDDPELDAVN